MEQDDKQMDKESTKKETNDETLVKDRQVLTSVQNLVL